MGVRLSRTFSLNGRAPWLALTNGTEAELVRELDMDLGTGSACGGGMERGSSYCYGASACPFTGAVDTCLDQEAGIKRITSARKEGYGVTLSPSTKLQSYPPRCPR